MAAPANDSIEARIPATCPDSISQILHRAWHHDLAGLKPLLGAPGRASVQEPTTGETPLHAAIRACAPSNRPSDHNQDEKEEAERTAAAEPVVRQLLLSGAIWNDVDDRDETPGCLADRLGLRDLYGLCVDAGVRAELLFGLLNEYEELESEEEAENEETTTTTQQEGQGEDADEEQVEIVDADPDRAFVPPKRPPGPDVNSEDYLRSDLTYSDGKLVDSEQNGVMMAWETSIMRTSVDQLLPGLPAGRRILNIGFGMGIVDGMFAATKPARHHIIEAHAGVLSHMNKPDSHFGSSWAASGPSDGAYRVHAGRWQDVVPQLMAAGETYDAVYFDTFGEDYAQLRLFFTEYVPALLEEDGRFGFFNGLGADRRVCYDVYARVVEMHLSDAGLDVEWQDLDVDMKDMSAEGEGEWQGVRRRYWTLDKYRLPTCTLMT
ncbi:arginine N-methyltransferase 2 [Hypoxylon sp. FL1284]|nr:arginine N-methyltransferase 2 [Hypoxylon sp. FL1284]